MSVLVTVVIPIYNVEQYLDRCINSVVNQTYKNLEIILVDDGSPDNCPAMCDAWVQKDSRIKVVHKENGGLGYARNSGMEVATGKYIFFFDSDDSIELTLVEKCVNAAQEHNSELVIFGRNNVYDDGRVEPRAIKVSDLYFEGEAVKTEILPYLYTYELGFGVSAWGKMYSLEMLRNNSLLFKSEREIISEDSYFTLELFSVLNNLSIVPECLYNYYKRDNSLSRAYKEGRQERNDVFLNKCLEYIESAQLPKKTTYHVMSRYHGLTLGTLMQIYRSDLPKDKKKKELKSVMKNPNLVATLGDEVLCLDSKVARLFWKVLRKKCYFLCNLLLWYNTHK